MGKQTDQQKISVLQKAEGDFRESGVSQHVVVCAGCTNLFHLMPGREGVIFLRLKGFLHDSIWACSEGCYTYLNQNSGRNWTQAISFFKKTAGAERMRIFKIRWPKSHYI